MHRAVHVTDAFPLSDDEVVAVPAAAPVELVGEGAGPLVQLGGAGLVAGKGFLRLA